jgi:hypothetical protein
MRLSENGKSVHIEIGFWLNNDGSIHLTSNELSDFHVAINEDGDRRNGHPTLYRRLATLLKQAGAPAPAIAQSD